MQDDAVNVNAQSVLSVDEMETLLRAEVEATSKGMQEGLQLFAEMRDRNTAAQKRLIALCAGQQSFVDWMA